MQTQTAKRLDSKNITKTESKLGVYAESITKSPPPEPFEVRRTDSGIIEEEKFLESQKSTMNSMVNAVGDNLPFASHNDTISEGGIKFITATTRSPVGGTLY